MIEDLQVQNPAWPSALGSKQIPSVRVTKICFEMFLEYIVRLCTCYSGKVKTSAVNPQNTQNELISIKIRKGYIPEEA